MAPTRQAATHRPSERLHRWRRIAAVTFLLCAADSTLLVERSEAAADTTCVRNGTTAEMASAYFGTRHDMYQGADYQRSFALPDGRILWTAQDAMLDGLLVHNIGVLQTANCFKLLGGSTGRRTSWLMPQMTRGNRQWYWSIGGEVSADGSALLLLVEQMNEHGRTYLSHSVPSATLLVTIRLADMAVLASVAAPANTPDVWGFSVTSDANYTYLYGYCYRQFGFGVLGADSCERDVKVARVPRGHLEQRPRFWDGISWQGDPDRAAVIFGVPDSGHDINPPQVRFAGSRFTMISQADDWFSSPSTVTSMYVADSATGPWRLAKRWPTSFRCEPSRCNTYFASWLADGSGWGISHNVWQGPQEAYYMPTFTSQRIRSQTAPL